MNNTNVNWGKWRDLFAARRERALPALEDPQDYSQVPDSVARSLAIFQLGESGGGTIIEQARKSRIRSAGPGYASAMRLFVDEEHRHAGILAICVRNLGGSLIRRNWTAGLFVFGRRLLGLRLKVLVLLVAEVVGICYYHLLATRLPPSRVRSLLAQIVDDERSHLHFHCSFLRAETRSAWRRLVFRATWRPVMLAAAVVTLLDHRAALRDLGLPMDVVWRRWMAYSRTAEWMITRQQALLHPGNRTHNAVIGRDRMNSRIPDQLCRLAPMRRRRLRRANGPLAADSAERRWRGRFAPRSPDRPGRGD